MLFLVFLIILSISSDRICNVLDYGAIGDGVSDDTKAIQTTINSCNSTNGGMNTILFPSNYNFLSYPFSLTHNNSQLKLSIKSTLTAAPDPQNWPTFIYNNAHRYVPLITRSNYWVYNNISSNITNIYNLSITGKGLINGNGPIWWKPYHHKGPPDLIDLRYVQNINISFITLLNSPRYHIWISNANNIVIHNINITSPDYDIAPNTDGIDIGATNAHIYDCYVKNGDDSYALKNGATNVVFENSTAIQGNGLEGGWFNKDSVNNCTFRNMVCNDTPFGIRLRSQSNMSNAVNNVYFNNITLNNVTKAIDINQFNQSIDGYDTFGFTGFNNISFSNIYGTYSQYAGTLDCSEQKPCHGLSFNNVILKTYNNNSQTWKCSDNVYGTQNNVTPPINCLQPG